MKVPSSIRVLTKEEALQRNQEHKKRAQQRASYAPYRKPRQKRFCISVHPDVEKIAIAIGQGVRSSGFEIAVRYYYETHQPPEDVSDAES